MKKFVITVSAALIVCALAFNACKEDDDPQLSVAGSPVTLSFGAAEDNAQSFEIRSNVAWTVSGNPAWLTVTPTSGTGDKSVSVQAAANTATTARTATLTVSVNGVDAVTVSVSQAAAAPAVVPVITITAQPAPLTTITEGAVSSSISITAEATEGATLAYQWYSNTLNSATEGTITEIYGATAATLVLPDGLTAAGSPYYYFCEVSATGAEPVLSEVARVTVNAPAYEIIIALQPPAYPIILTEGSTSARIDVSAYATDEDVSVTYHWYSNNAPTNEGGNAISGATGATFRTSSLTAGTYYYFCEFRATDATPVRSNVVTVTVKPNTLKMDKTWYDANPSATSFSIGAADQLAYLALLVNGGVNFSGKTINLTADINLTGDWIPIGNNNDGFQGTFDGKGKTISNLTISGSGGYKGLFGWLLSGGTVKNVRLAGVSISTDGEAVGGVTGKNDGTIENCSVAGAISGNSFVGGIAGVVGSFSARDATVRNCRSAVNVTINNSSGAGGIAGGNNGTVEYCYATGSVTATDDGSIGGIVGHSWGILRHCAALNSSVSTASDYFYVGNSIGRVIGYGDAGTMLSDNYADNAMTVTGLGYTPFIGNGYKDGASITATEYHSAAWWRTTAGFSETVWMLADGKLPALK